MNLSDAARSIGTQVLNDLTATGEELGPELRERAEACAQMAAQLLLDGLEGEAGEHDAEIIAARFQALRAAGAVALAGAIIDTIRTTALKGLSLLATL